MTLLNQVIKEMASAGSVGAGAIAAVPGSLFQGGTIYDPYKKTKKKKTKVLKRAFNESLSVNSDNSNFDPSDVISKLDAAEKKIKAEEDTVSFGLEDDQGALVRVYVRAEQADEFENALAALLAQADENDDETNTSMEIAEVLYDLKDKFEIVDINWGDIPTDEEEEQQVLDDQEGEDQEMQADMQSPEGEDQQLDPNADPMSMGGGEDESMKSTLQQVIDMLKSNAEAQKAEADARKAEAESKIAEYAAKAAESKIRQEEQVLDMEDYYNKKDEEQKEAKRLAKLAKFKHDKASDAEKTLSGGSFGSIRHDMEMSGGEEEEEQSFRVTPTELARIISRSLSRK